MLFRFRELLNAQKEDIAALITAVVGGFFLILLAGPLVAATAFLLSLAADLIWPRSRP